MKVVKKTINLEEGTLKEVVQLLEDLGINGRDRSKLVYRFGNKVSARLKELLGAIYLGSIWGITVELDTSLNDCEVICEYRGE